MLGYGNPLPNASLSTCADYLVISSPSPNRSDYDLDLVDFLHVKTSEHDNIFKGAIQLLESMKSSPSCNRIAASKLLASCKSIEKSASDERQPTLTSLDRVKSVYAARLALCEIAEAGAAIPSPCSPLYISSSPKKAVSGSIFGQQWATPDQLNPTSMESLDSCLHALESRPQWWTSYSNSRQNAVMICQAARIDLEKEEVLELHRRITENTLRLNNGLQDAIQNAAAVSAQHRAFIHATESMQRDLLRDIEEAGASTLSIFPRLINGIEAAVGSTITRIISSLGGVENDTANLQKVRRAVICKTAISKSYRMSGTLLNKSAIYEMVSASLMRKLLRKVLNLLDHIK